MHALNDNILHNLIVEVTRKLSKEAKEKPNP